MPVLLCHNYNLLALAEIIDNKIEKVETSKEKHSLTRKLVWDIGIRGNCGVK